MSFIQHHTKLFLLLLPVFIVTILTNAQEPYEPFQTIKIIEPWRWHKLDPLNNNFIYCGIEKKDGTLLFVTEKEFLSYDGYHVTKTPFSKDFENIQTFAIHIDKDGYTYLNTSIGLISYFQNKWELLLEYDHYYPEERPFFAENRDGLLIVATPGGIFELKKGQAINLLDYNGGFCSAVATGGKLFLSPIRRDEVLICEFTRKGISNPETWKQKHFDEKIYQGLYLLPGDEQGEVYALNYIRKNGISRYNPEQEKWQNISIANNYLDKSFFTALSLSSDTLIIFGKSSTFILNESGLQQLEKQRFQQPINGIFSFKRENGNLIIGGRSEGVMEVDLSNDRYMTYQNLHFQCEDLDNRSWFISKDSKVISNNPRSKFWQEHNENVIDTPLTIICSNDGIVWTAGSNNGVAAISRYDGFHWEIQEHPELGETISHLSLYQLSDGRVLAGSGEELPETRAGLVVYEKINDEYEFKLYGQPIVPSRIAGIVECPNGEIWIGGFGLYKLDPNFKSPYKTPTKLLVEWVDSIQPAPQNDVYLGLWERGLIRVRNESWASIKRFNNTADNLISTILQDNQKDETYWIATQSGISKIDPHDCVTQLLPHDFGMLREEGTLKQSHDGALWINQADRNWYFSDNYDRRTLVNNFKTVRYKPDSEKPTVKILDYDSRSTEPANIHFTWHGTDKWSLTGQEQLRYSYKIDQNEWSLYTNKTSTILLNFPIGKHTFNVRVKDLDGNIAELSQPIEFQVYPPTWKRPWFLLIIIVTILVFAILLYLLVRQRVRHFLQLDELKLQFFTNMSHELRTPLMLIIGPLETLIEKLPKNFDKTPAQIAYKNSKKMLHLVDQILEFRKVEFGSMEINIVHSDIIKEIKDSIHLHKPMAEDKNIHLVSSFTQENYITEYDSGKLDRVLSNLLTNAIKYTQENGTILIKTHIECTNIESGPVLQLCIEDDGEGIESDKLAHIFEPFYRVSSNAAKARGVGLGLSLVKNLLESMNGDISVESPIRIENKVNKGTRFNVFIPLQNSHTEQTITADLPVEATPEPTEKPDKEYSDEKVVLIVEDEKDVREYIGNELKSVFSIEYATNGIEGLKKAKKIIPDLILTDVLMPEMDGNELCEKIRSFESTSHIPIIALTALKSTEHELKTLTKGADDFLTKPVSVNVLKQKILNAIQSRELLQSNYKSQLSSAKNQPEQEIKGSADDLFIQKAKLYIESHLEDPFFDVENLATALGMSRMTLYRKVKAITGESPSELIRVTRLNVAAKLLLEGDMNVSEIADHVGYQDLSHFSGSFKKYYNCSPSQYLRNQRFEKSKVKE